MQRERIFEDYTPAALEVGLLPDRLKVKRDCSWDGSCFLISNTCKSFERRMLFSVVPMKNCIHASIP